MKRANDISKIKGVRAGKEVKSTRANRSKSTQAEKSTATSNTGCFTQLGTSQVPSLDYIKANNQIQRSVEDRIKELQRIAKTGMSESKIKSQRGGQVDVFVTNRIKWSHVYIVAGTQKERVSYDQLTMGQWMTGFLQSHGGRNLCRK